MTKAKQAWPNGLAAGVERPIAGSATHVPPWDGQISYSLDRYRRVSYERLVSGPGLVNVYQFLRDTGKGKEPVWLAEQMRQGDPAPLISQHAVEGKVLLCVLALEIFVSLYGAEAGNLAP